MRPKRRARTSPALARSSSCSSLRCRCPRAAISSASAAFQTEWNGAAAAYEGGGTDPYQPAPLPPSYKPPKKNWRLKRGATPQWYKQRHGVRTKALSGAARVISARRGSPRNT